VEQSFEDIGVLIGEYPLDVLAKVAARQEWRRPGVSRVVRPRRDHDHPVEREERQEYGDHQPDPRQRRGTPKLARLVAIAATGLAVRRRPGEWGGRHRGLTCPS